MDYRGPILLVFGMSLIMSPIAINIVEYGTPWRSEDTEVAAVEIDTGCQGQELYLTGKATLCTSQTSASRPTRSMPGGALFVSARD